MFCGKCGTQLNDNAKFCSACGAPVAPDAEALKIPRCKNCGEPIEADANFCPNCGEPYCMIESLEQRNSQEQGGMTNGVATNRDGGGGIGIRIIGIAMMIVGVLLINYGGNLNNSVEAQLNSLFSSGATNPGTGWITFGALGAVLGLVLLIVSFRKK